MSDPPQKRSARLSVRFDPEAIRALRLERKWTQGDLVTASELSEATVGRIENGQSVSLDTAQKLCICFDVDLGSIAAVSPNSDDVVFEAKPRDMSYLFHDMLKELSDVVGTEEAVNVMNEMFRRLQDFPFGKHNRDELYKRKKYDLDAFIAILEFRAGAILFTFKQIYDGQIKLREGKGLETVVPPDRAQAQATEWTDRFTELHERHVQAIRDGQLLLAHEIRREIGDFLPRIVTDDHYYFFKMRELIYSSH